MLSEHAEALKEIAPLAGIPIALGERLCSRWDFKQILEAGYVDIIQPDPSGNDLLDYVLNPQVFDYADGYVKTPDGPGLGIEVNEAYVRERAAVGHRWRNPVWRHADGSFAEW